LARTMRWATVDSRDEKRTGNLLGRQPPEQAMGECDASVSGEDGMAGHEQKPQEVVTHPVLERVQVGLGRRLVDLRLATELLSLSLQHSAPAHHVDGPAFPYGHQPRARIVGDT